MSAQDITWIFVILSLAGNYFVIQKNVTGQWLWTVSNTGWVIYDVSIGQYTQATLFGAYLIMSIWGTYAWTKEKREKANKDSCDRKPA